MKIETLFLCLILFILFLFIGATGSEAFQIKVSPQRIYQGDVFVIKVSGMKHSPSPSAILEGKQMSFSSCGEGCFIAIGAVDIDTKPGRKTVSLNIRKKKTKVKFSARSKEFPLIYLTLSEEKVSPGEEDMKRIEKENERLKELWGKETEKIWEGDFIKPVENEISTVFGTKRVLNQERESIHRGIDLKAKEGEEVRASNSGKVMLAEELFFGGNTLILDHGQGIYTVYMHLSVFNVKPGDIVSKGEVIGLAGSTGRASGPHLHFSVKVSGTSANPVSLFGLKL